MNGEEEYEQESAFELFLSLGAPWLRLKTGCEDVDVLLEGGFVRGELTEVVGSIAVGKTQMCLSVTASVLKGDDSSFVIYLDTNASFRASRLLHILMARGVDAEQATKLLSRVLVMRIFDENELKDALSAAEKCGKDVSLLVIDSIGAALAETALSYLEGGRETQDEVIVRLHRMARSMECAVVTTNHLVYPRQCPAPSLGRKWNNAVHSRLLMAALPHSHYIQMILSKRVQLTGDRAYYHIEGSGIAALDADEVEEQTQNTQSIVTQNWDAIMDSYSQTAFLHSAQSDTECELTLSGL